MRLKILNIFLFAAVLGANYYFLPLTIQIIKSGGGPFGFGVLILPFTLIINSLIIPSFLATLSKYAENSILKTINIMGAILIIFLSYLFYTIPEQETLNEHIFIGNANGTKDTIRYDQSFEKNALDSSQNSKREESFKDDCVFNNDIKVLSIEAITKYDSTLSYNWNPEDKEVTTIFGNDTLYLSIGGCNHFNLIAGLRTNKKNFEDTAYWFAKAKWLSKNFLSQSIGDDYTKAIDNHQLINRRTNTLNEIHYDLPTDTTMTNIYYSGVTINRNAKRTWVEIGGYVN